MHGDLVVKQASSSVIMPPAKHGSCSGGSEGVSARVGAAQKATASTSGLWSVGASEKCVENSKGGSGQARAEIRRCVSGAGLISSSPSDIIAVHSQGEEEGCANPSVLWQRRFRTVERAWPSKLFPRHKWGSWASGSSAQRPVPNTWSKGLASAKSLSPVP